VDRTVYIACCLKMLEVAMNIQNNWYVNEIQVWSIDDMMLTAENGNIRRKTFPCSSFSTTEAGG